MKIFSWNVRGFNHSARQSFVKTWVNNNRPLIGGILETRVLEENAQRIVSSAFPGWRWDNNYSCAELGRIWVVWDPSVSVVVYKKSAQFMLCGVFDPATGISVSVAFIYGFNTEGQRKELWRELSELNLSPSLKKFSLVVGWRF